MRIHLLSDIHAEVRPFTPRYANADVIVLAGDIYFRGQSAEWILETFADFPGKIIFVAGNHDFYDAQIASAQKNFAQAAAQSQGKLHYLERQSLVLDGVRFLGATCWTDFQFGGNPVLAKLDADRTIADYHRISMAPGGRRLRPDDTEQIARVTRRWLEQELVTPFTGKTVLVTHHPITALSSDPQRAPELLDAIFYNTWESLLSAPYHAPDLMLHGHTHFAVDYVIADGERRTRVVSNPRGYPNEDGRLGFKPELVVEV